MQKETEYIVKPLVNLLEHNGWYCIKTHGSIYQMGLPDLLISHPTYSPRWVECKITGGTFTDAQKKVFPRLIMNNVPIYLIEGDDFRGPSGLPALKAAYAKILSGRPNAAYYLLDRSLKI